MFKPEWEEQVCSLGYDIADWLEAYACHGPGDIQGEPIAFDAEMLAFLVEAYRLDPVTGARVYDEAVLSRPKGRAKSELAGLIGVAEALGPVRFAGWTADGQPVGDRVTAPLIKCLATEEDQAGNTFENIAFIAGVWGPDKHPDIYGGIKGVRQYQAAKSIWLPVDEYGGGEIRACTSGAASKDGGKETFVVADETHLYVLPELQAMYGTVRRNLGKRKMAEPWLLQTTTAYRSGEQSIAEKTLTRWRKNALGPETLVDHREAKGKIDLDDKDHTLKQLRHVYGAAAEWMDLARIYRLMLDPTVCPDIATAARYFLNRVIASKDAWIATDVVERQSVLKLDEADPRRRGLEPGEPIALGFDGSLNDDSTVLWAARMSDPFVCPIGIWEKPDGPEDALGWSVPRDEVKEAVDEAFMRYDVVRLYADPHEWRSEVEAWAERHGAERVFSWETRRDLQMGAALDRLHTGLTTGEVWHDGDPRGVEHFGNAYVRRKAGQRLVRKEHPDSDRKIDSVIGAALALEARADGLAAGPPKKGPKRAVGRVRHR